MAANFVIAGPASCSATAKAELLADTLKLSLPNFKVKTIFLEDAKWAEWLETTCKKWDWKHASSPLVWRELGEGNTAGTYVGGEREFAKLVEQYYGVKPDPDADIAARVAANVAALPFVRARAWEGEGRMLTIALIPATAPATYALLPHLLPPLLGLGGVHLRLLDGPSRADPVHGVVMELEDCALAGVTQSTHVDLTAVDGSDVVIYLGSTEESLSAAAVGGAIEAAAKKPVHVIVASASPVDDFIALVRAAPSLPKAAATVPMVLQENRARHLIAARLNQRVDVAQQINGTAVHNVVVWGSPASGIVDIVHAHVVQYGGIVGGEEKIPVLACLRDDEYALTGVQTDAAARAARPGNAASHAASIARHLRFLLCGTAEGECVSMGLVTTAESGYGLPAGVLASMPVTVLNGTWTVVQGLQLSAHIQQKLNAQALDGVLQHVVV
eukprot:m.231915 g.231915  ORF g.231915 m.231915 type:complete len:444 (+) comp18537_c0_seq1:43-1374(+)